MARPGFRRQLDILVDRSLAVHAGSWGTLLMMLAQAPIIGWFIGLAWKGQEAVPQTYFIMSVAALWMGCMNACTAIVGERSIFLRERMFDLDIRSYLLSKLCVLSAVCAVQTVLLLAAQGRLMHLKESWGALLLIFLSMSWTGVAACGLGLLVSAVARSAYGAVAAVPVILIPQAIFSKVLLGANIEKGASSFIEKLTLTKWCYEALVDIHDSAHLLTQFKSLAALGLGLALFLALAAGALSLAED
ncbi:MAG: ABC transporter permease [Elusimicrobia bacterium]|nr:ABC transporter permease [Elusimicrobiota bacterium]